MACHAWSSEKMKTMFGGWRAGAGALAGAGAAEAAAAAAAAVAAAQAHDERARSCRMFFEDEAFM